MLYFALCLRKQKEKTNKIIDSDVKDLSNYREKSNGLKQRFALKKKNEKKI